MANLYELKEEYLAVLDAMQSDELDNEAAYELLQQLRGDIKDKAKNIGYAIKNLNSDAEAIDIEIKRLQERKKAMVNREARLKDFLLYVMRELNVKGFQDPVMPIRRVTNSQPTVHIEDISLIPSEYLLEKVEVKVDKKSIIKDIGDKAIEGVTVITGEHIRLG